MTPDWSREFDEPKEHPTLTHEAAQVPVWTSGGRGLMSGAGLVSSNLDFRSVAFSMSATATSRFLVDRASFKSVAACRTK
jgi:hypothetical protein